MAREKTDAPWDIQEIGRRVRAQRNVLADRQATFVTPVHDLRKSTERDEATRKALVESIGIVNKAGG